MVTLTAAWTEYTEKKLGLLFPNVSVRWPEFVQAAAGKAVQGAADEPKFELYVKTAVRSSYSRRGVFLTDAMLFMCLDTSP